MSYYILDFFLLLLIGGAVIGLVYLTETIGAYHCRKDKR